MFRGLGAAAVGCFVLVTLVLVGTWLMWSGFGSDNIFVGETPEVSPTFLGAMLLLGLIAALIGGFATSRVGGRSAAFAVGLLTGGLLMMGGLFLASQLQFVPQPLPEGQTVNDLSFFELAPYIIQPAWYHYANFAIGPIGVLAGGHLGRPRWVE